MKRREVLPVLAAGALQAAPGRALDVALLTHAGAPHLSAYLAGLRQTPEAARVWLSNREVEAEARKVLGAKLAGVFDTPQELFREQKPPLALIPMEAAIAPPAIDAALDAGCHVMAEKPACVRAEDFAPLAAKATARKQHLLLAFANRIDPVMREARRLLQSGEIGKLYGLEMHTIADQTRLTSAAYQKTWIAQKSRAGGGHLIWLGIHWIDLAMFLTGSRIRQVSGFTANVGGQPIDTEDAAVLSLRFDNGMLGTLTSGYYLDKGKHLAFRFWGSKGWLEIHFGDPEQPLRWQPHGKPEKYASPAGESGYTPWVRHVTRVALGEEQAVLTAEESLYALRTVFAGYAAADSGRVQSVDGGR